MKSAFISLLAAAMIPWAATSSAQTSTVQGPRGNTAERVVDRSATETTATTTGSNGKSVKRKTIRGTGGNVGDKSSTYETARGTGTRTVDRSKEGTSSTLTTAAGQTVTRHRTRARP